MTQATSRSLAGSLKHLRYELGMFQLTAVELIAGRIPEGVVRNALLESFTVHARILLQFFFPASPGDDEVLAAHYFADKEWAKLRGPVPESLETVRARVGKEVAHLTFDRVDIGPEAKLWHIADMLMAMTEIVDKFFAHLPAEYHPALGIDRSTEVEPTALRWPVPPLSGTQTTAVNSTTVNTVVWTPPTIGDGEQH